jgi:hypothetical protein
MWGSRVCSRVCEACEVLLCSRARGRRIRREGTIRRACRQRGPGPFGQLTAGARCGCPRRVPFLFAFALRIVFFLTEMRIEFHTVGVGVDVDACGYNLYMKMAKQMVLGMTRLTFACVLPQTICFAIFSTNEN